MPAVFQIVKMTPAHIFGNEFVISESDNIMHEYCLGELLNALI